MTGAASETVTLAQAMQMALAHHQAGRLPQAEAIYQQILQAEPSQPDALHFLGVIAKQVGKHEIAVELIGRALSVKPDYAAAHNNLGTALQELGRDNEAIEYFHKALALKPDYAEAYNNLGTVIHSQGKVEEATACYRKALALKPDYAEAYNNLGNVLQKQGELELAIESFHKALALKPDFAGAYNNLGNALHAQGQLGDAVGSYRKALMLKPDYAEAHSNLGNALKEMGDFSAARSSVIRAIELAPDQASFRVNHGTLLLAEGDFNGWHGHEARWATPHMRKRDYPHPWWDGRDLSGKTILVWGEQGIGDELLYASLIPEMARLAGGCVFECEHRLVSLFARSFPEVEVIPRSTPPHPRTDGEDIALQSPAGSLMRWLRPRLDSFPQHSGYLKADEARVEHWKKRLDVLGAGSKVGICWTSGDRSAVALKHCIGLEQWAPIFGVKGAIFINLQYTDCREELAQAEQRFGVKIHCWDDIDLKNDLDEVAALTTALDLVISVETAVPIMAGALGKPAWTMVLKNASRLQLGTDRIPWYPDTKLFCRAWNETWGGVIGAVSHELELLTAGEVK